MNELKIEAENKAAAPRKPLKKRKHGLMQGPQAMFFVAVFMFVPFLIGIVWDLFGKFATISLMFRDQYGTGFGFYWISWAFRELFTTSSHVFISLTVAGKVVALNLFIFTPLQFVMGFFFSRKMPFERALRTIFFLPSIISQIVTVAIFQLMFDNSFGPLLEFAKLFTGGELPLEGLLYNKDTAFTMILIYMAWVGLGGPVIILTATLNKVPEELYEASRLEGISMWGEFIYIAVPMSSQMLSVYFLNNMLSGFSIYTEILLLTDPAQSNVYSFAYLITQGSIAGQYYRSASIGFICTIIAIPVVAIVRWAADRFLPDTSV